MVHRKRSLSPIQREIVWMLGETWTETIPTVLNTLLSARLIGNTSADIELIEREVYGLIELGAIMLTRPVPLDGIDDVLLTEKEMSSVKDWKKLVAWNRHDERWTWNVERWGNTRIGITLIASGEAYLRK